MVTNLDGTTRSYQYTDNNHPTSLTGYVDEQGTTQTTWAYDTQNRATATQDAGGANAVSLTYNTNGTVTKTDALGAVLTLSYQWIGDLNHLIAISGSQCPSCREPAATTYDAAGCVSSRADYNGNLTCYANYAARGLELHPSRRFCARQYLSCQPGQLRAGHRNTPAKDFHDLECHFPRARVRHGSQSHNELHLRYERKRAH